MLEVSGLSVNYGKHRALDNAALRVAPGEIVVILGANGAGKSTLLKAVAGICEGRATGSVVMDGAQLLGQKPDRIVEAGLALVPEGRGIFGDLTVQENLTLGAYAERARDDEARNLERVLRLFPKLAERRRQTVRTMSGGEQQMVAIGRAMMSSPSILALDEPSLGLSPMLCRDLFQSLLVVRKAGLGVLLVEQNAKQSLKIADRGYLLENGAIVHEDTADALSRDPAVQMAYLGGGSGRAAPRVPAAVPTSRAVTSSAPRPSSGPSPSEIAAAALRRVGGALRPAATSSLPATPRPAATPAPTPAPTGPVSAAPQLASAEPTEPDVGDLVARATARASRRTPSGPVPGALPPRPTKLAPAPVPSPRRAEPSVPDLSSSSNRLRAVLEEIEAAARRAESYKPRTPGR